MIKSQIGGCVCLNMVEKPSCLRPDYAYSTTREGKSAADVGPFSTLQFNKFQNNQISLKANITSWTGMKLSAGTMWILPLNNEFVR